MDAMPRPRPPHLHREVSRHGTVSWVVRVGHGPRVYLREPYGSAEFWAAYHAAVRGDTPPARRTASPGTLKWLWERYQTSQDWRGLSLATQRQRLNVMARVIADAADMPIAAMTKRHVAEGRDRRADTPAAARHFVVTLRGLFRWAVDIGHATTDPTEGVKVARPATEGHAVWPAEWVERFCARWPLGTRQRVAFEILLCTGLRRGDACRVGRQHVKAGVLTIRAGKNGVDVAVPILPRLAEALAAGPCGDLHFIVTEAGRPRTVAGFGNWFREACIEAGVAGSAHGLRKAMATNLADHGASEWELDAALGWTGGKTSAIYTRKANRQKLAAMALGRLSSTEPAQPIPNPVAGVGRKDK